jgi:hypothetical protein
VQYDSNGDFSNDEYHDDDCHRDDDDDNHFDYIDSNSCTIKYIEIMKDFLK